MSRGKRLRQKNKGKNEDFMKTYYVWYTFKNHRKMWKIEAESEKDARLKWCAWFTDNCRIVEIQ